MSVFSEISGSFRGRGSLFRNHGFGIGLRPCHFPVFKNHPPASIDWVEALTENYLPWRDCPRPKSRQNLLQVRRNLPVALHGVSLSLGSADPLNPEYLKALKDLISEVDPLWISDHLCWSSYQGEYFHDLLPLPYTRETIRHVTEKISRVQDFLGRRILIENLSSYVEFNASEMPEWEFLTEIANLADCGILLDVNNIYVSAVNHGFSPLQYLKAIPGERVGQIHLAGHSNNGTHLVDTHDAPVCEEVWDLYRWTARNLGPVTAMVEWDSKIPELQVLENEIGKARSIHAVESLENPISL